MANGGARVRMDRQKIGCKRKKTAYLSLATAGRSQDAEETREGRENRDNVGDAKLDMRRRAQKRPIKNPAEIGF